MVLLLIKILDYLDMLDTVAALLRLIVAAWKPQAWPSPLAAVSGIAAPGM